MVHSSLRSAMGLLSGLPEGHHVLAVAQRLLCKLMCCTSSTTAYADAGHLQVARHTGSTIAFHMKNYGNFTQVGCHPMQLTPAHAAMCVIIQATVGPVTSMHAARIIPMLQRTCMHRA